jgi:hypothetical protein
LIKTLKVSKKFAVLPRVAKVNGKERGKLVQAIELAAVDHIN